MKKTLKLIITTMLLFALTVSFAACGGGSNVDSEKASKVAEYVEANKDVVESMSSDVYSIELKADGDKVVYIYTYKGVEYSDELKAALEEQVKASEEQFEEVFEGIKGECAEVGAVVYTYVDTNGKEIYSYEFK